MCSLLIMNIVQNILKKRSLWIINQYVSCIILTKHSSKNAYLVEQTPGFSYVSIKPNCSILTWQMLTFAFILNLKSFVRDLKLFPTWCFSQPTPEVSSLCSSANPVSCKALILSHNPPVDLKNLDPHWSWYQRHQEQ